MLKSWFLLFLMSSAACFAQSDTLIIENGLLLKKYLLSQIDSITFYVPVVGVEESETAGSPADFAVSQNFPNPFNPSTQMKCTIPQEGNVAVKIFDINGALIRDLFTGEKDKGEHLFLWDGKNSAGASVASGTYLFTVQFNSRQLTRKIILLK